LRDENRWPSQWEDWTEDDWYKIKYSNPEKTRIASGRFNSYNGIHKEYEIVLREIHIPSRHYTYIFTTFVML